MKFYTYYTPYIKAAKKAIREYRKETEFPLWHGFATIGKAPRIDNLSFKDRYGFETFISDKGIFYFETDLSQRELVDILHRFMD